MVLAQNFRKGELHIGRGEGSAVVPLRVLDQMESVRKTVFRNPPRLREIGSRVEIVIRLGEKIENTRNRKGIDDVVGDRQVQGAWVAACSHDERPTVFGLLLAKGDAQSKKDRKEKQDHANGYASQPKLTTCMPEIHRASLLS